MSDAASPDWNAISFIDRHRGRKAVVRRLADGPSTPRRIADAAEIDIATVSSALTQLRERGYVDLLVDEDTRKGRLYALTDEGERHASDYFEAFGGPVVVDTDDTATPWDAVAFIEPSENRCQILATLVDGGPATPTELSADVGVKVPHISRELSRLEDRGLVELTVSEDTKKGRYYAATPTGVQAAKALASLDNGGATADAD